MSLCSNFVFGRGGGEIPGRGIGCQGRPSRDEIRRGSGTQAFIPWGGENKGMPTGGPPRPGRIVPGPTIKKNLCGAMWGTRPTSASGPWIGAPGGRGGIARRRPGPETGRGKNKTGRGGGGERRRVGEAGCHTPAAGGGERAFLARTAGAGGAFRWNSSSARMGVETTGFAGGREVSIFRDQYGGKGGAKFPGLGGHSVGGCGRGGIWGSPGKAIGRINRGPKSIALPPAGGAKS